MKDKPGLFELLKKGLEDGIRHARGEISLRTWDVELPDPAPILKANEITTLRKSLGQSQSVFAMCLNVSPRTVQAWEQGIRKPDGAALRLMELARRDPGLLGSLVKRNMHWTKGRSGKPRVKHPSKVASR